MREFLARLQNVYGPPFGDNPDGFLAEYARLLGHYSPAILEAAADRLLATHKGPHRWPRISECVKACEDVIVAAGKDRRLSEPARDRNPDWSPEAIARANKLIQCDLGQRAAQEGWITQLWDYCRKYRELPSTHEIERGLPRDPRKYGGLIAEARRFDEAYGRTSEGSQMRKLGDAMLARRDRLSAIAQNAGGN